MVLALYNVHRVYQSGGQDLRILAGVNFQLEGGHCVALVGPSGVGKTTLLQIAGLLDIPTTGTVTVCGQPIDSLSDAKRSLLRNAHLGFVFQNHMLMAEFTALENVMMPLIIAGCTRAVARGEAHKMLQAVGLAARINHRPMMLSGGEQQRVAVARALVHRPKLLIADEPTGNLDVHTTGYVFDMILGLVREQGVGALIATHSPVLAQQMDQIISLEEGKIVEGRHVMGATL